MTHSTDTPVIGIDPGAQGAISLVCGDVAEVHEMPTYDKKTSRGKNRPRTAVHDLLSILRQMRAKGARIAFIEDVWGVKGQQAGGAAALGHNLGCLETACAAASLAVVWVSPVRWKYDMNVLNAGKTGARVLAMNLFPELNAAKTFTVLRRQRTLSQAEGNAEACLVAEWGRQHYKNKFMAEGVGIG